MILAIDPSSSKCGYALMTGVDPAGLREAGLLVPTPRKLELLPRVGQFAADLLEIIAEQKPEALILEISTTRHGHAKNQGAASSLGVYGLAVGYLLRTCQQTGIPLHTLEATVWTARVPKDERSAQIAAWYRNQYDPAGDPGGDVADAIGIGRWWLMRHPKVGAVASGQLSARGRRGR